jgi:Fe-S-cluster containining protein
MMSDDKGLASRHAGAALGVLEEASAATEEFAVRTGIRCREGCGQCCLKPGIEARVVEMLPMAMELLRLNEADQYYDKAAADPDGRCVFYAPEAGDETLGRCRHYRFRPSVCRLFGFAATGAKDGRAPQLVACSWHKKLQPQAVAAAQHQIDRGAVVPQFAEFGLRLQMLGPAGTQELLAINRALMQAIEKLSLVWQSQEVADVAE